MGLMLTAENLKFFIKCYGDISVMKLVEILKEDKKRVALRNS